ncbi:hypothetical protein [Cetobacterium sp.]|uniref:hypothetical protein n=1 Tax=Cetobacterium sp. TaxID=2071632 RepID=UPI002FC81288
MKKQFFIGILVLSTITFSSNKNNELQELREKLPPKEQMIFDEVFDANEMLIDSYKTELKFLKKSDFNYSEKSKFLELKIQELENKKNSEVNKLKNNLISRSEQYKKI